MKTGERVDSIRVLLVTGLTEVTLALPALRALRVHFPAARLSIVTSPAGRELLETLPWIDEAHGIGRFRKGEVFAMVTGYRTVRSISRLRQMGREGLMPDLEVDLTGGLTGAVGAAVLRRLLGGDAAAGSWAGGGWLEKSESILRQGAPLHRSHYYLQRLEPLGVRPVIANPELVTSHEADLRIEKLLHRLGVESGQLLIGLHPGRGFGASEQGWPSARLVRLGERLIHQFDARLLILAGRGEEERSRRLAAALPARATKRIELLPLVDYLSLTARLSLLIANAGAVPHLAAAVGTPVVSVSITPARARLNPYEISDERAITISAPHYDQPDLHNEVAVFEAACRLLALNRTRLLRDRQR